MQFLRCSGKTKKKKKKLVFERKKNGGKDRWGVFDHIQELRYVANLFFVQEEEVTPKGWK